MSEQHVDPNRLSPREAFEEVDFSHPDMKSALELSEAMIQGARWGLAKLGEPWAATMETLLEQAQGRITYARGMLQNLYNREMYNVVIRPKGARRNQEAPPPSEDDLPV